MKIFNLCILFLCLFCACNDDDSTDDPDTPDQIKLNGFSYVESNQSYDATVSTLAEALTAAGPIKVVAQVDHKANAASVDQTLNNTSVILFGNPALGTPLMQNNQLAGLDLPQKYLVYEDANGITRVAFNDTEYIAQRHGLEGEESLTTINGALNNFAGMTTDTTLFTNVTDVELGEGITTKVSANSFDVTYEKLFAAIDGNPNLGIVAEVNHQTNATSVNLELRPTKLIIFGNPNLGSPLMISSQTVGLDLPQKILVWETADATVNVAYNNPTYIATRHELNGVDEQLTTIATALDNLSNAAITE